MQERIEGLIMKVKENPVKAIAIVVAATVITVGVVALVNAQMDSEFEQVVEAINEGADSLAS